MASVDVFKHMHSAFAQTLSARLAPEVMIDRLVNQAFAFFENSIGAMTATLPDLDCYKGCSACCTLRVSATAPEIFLLARYVRLIDAAPAGVPINLPKRIAQAHRATGGRNEQERMALRRRCPFIMKGVCIIHPVRPLACRGHASFDRIACAHATAGRNVDVPVSEPHLHLRGLVQQALQAALRDAGLAWGQYELNHGVLVALSDGPKQTSWAEGHDSLAAASTDSAPLALAAAFDAILAG